MNIAVVIRNTHETQELIDLAPDLALVEFHSPGTSKFIYSELRTAGLHTNYFIPIALWVENPSSVIEALALANLKHVYVYVGVNYRFATKADAFCSAIQREIPGARFNLVTTKYIWENTNLSRDDNQNAQRFMIFTDNREFESLSFETKNYFPVFLSIEDLSDEALEIAAGFGNVIIWSPKSVTPKKLQELRLAGVAAKNIKILKARNTVALRLSASLNAEVVGHVNADTTCKIIETIEPIPGLVFGKTPEGLYVMISRRNSHNFY